MPSTITIKNITDEKNDPYVWIYDERLDTATLLQDPVKETCNDPQILLAKFKAILSENEKFIDKQLLQMQGKICLYFVSRLGLELSYLSTATVVTSEHFVGSNSQDVTTDYNDGITIRGITLFRQGEFYVLPPATPSHIQMYAVEKMTAYLHEIDNLIPEPYQFIRPEFSQLTREQFSIRQTTMTILQQMWEDLLPLALIDGNYLSLQQWRNEAVKKIQTIITEYEQSAMQTVEASFVAGKAMADGIIYRGRQANGNFILMPARIYLGQNELNYDPLSKAYKIPSDCYFKIGSHTQITFADLLQRLSLSIEIMAYSDAVVEIDLIKLVLKDAFNALHKHSAISSLFLLLAYNKINKLLPKKYSLDLSGYPDYSNVVVYAWSTFKSAPLFWLFDRESPEIMRCYLPIRYSTEDIESIFSDLLDMPNSDVFAAFLSPKQKAKLKHHVSLLLLDPNYVQIEQRKLSLSKNLLTTIDNIYQSSFNSANSSATKFFTGASLPGILGKRKNEGKKVDPIPAANQKFIKR